VSRKYNSQKILSLLKTHYPHAKIALNFSNPWELLVAVVLSAQCTDKRVNIITDKLFKKYKSFDDYINADLTEFELDIKSAGFFRNKAKNILASAKIIRDKFNGLVPETMNEILTLPGIARKSANVILGNAFGFVEGIAVDTHVIRLSKRLGLSKNSDPVKIETDLMKKFTKKDWFKLTYLLIEHGRNICEAKKPKCNICFLNKICPSAFAFPRFKPHTRRV